jgi:hypothetical protein
LHKLATYSFRLDIDEESSGVASLMQAALAARSTLPSGFSAQAHEDISTTETNSTRDDFQGYGIICRVEPVEGRKVKMSS